MAKKKQVKKANLLFKPHKYQQEYLDQFERFNVCICHRRWGKTYLAAFILCTYALSVPNSKLFYLAPQKGQAKDITWPVFTQILSELMGAKQVSLNNQSLEVRFANGSLIKLYGANDGGAEVMRGSKYLFGVIDEFDDMDMGIWDNIIMPALIDTGGGCLFIGTIKPFGNLEYMKSKNSDDPDWNICKYRLSECWEGLDQFTAKDIEMLRRQYEDKPNEYAREFECDEKATTADQLIPVQVIQLATERPLSQEDYVKSPRIMGVDVARFGDDTSCICKRQGMYTEPILTFAKMDSTRLADMVAREIDLWNPDAVFIDAGRGEGVIDRLRLLGYRVTEVPFQGAALDPHYLNRRAEMWDKCGEWMKNGGSIPPDKQLQRDLGSPTFKFTNSGKMQLESKADIKKRTQRSPDKGDALALTFAAPVRHKAKGGLRNSTQHVNCQGFNPLANQGVQHGQRTRQNQYRAPGAFR